MKNQIDRSVIDRCNKNLWGTEPKSDMNLLIEEVGELAREIRRIEDGRERPDEDEVSKEDIIKEIGSEIGDILFVLVKIAHHYGLKLDECYDLHDYKMNKRYNN